MQRYTTNYIVCCTLSGDVDQIFNTSGNLVARYIYDTWGNTVSVTDASGNAITSTTHIANINPIRYRGYYWDKETGFYYLQSRYYDTETKRFVNADGYVLTGQDMQSANMYAYCGNNPVTRSDVGGNAYLIEYGGANGAFGGSLSWPILTTPVTTTPSSGAVVGGLAAASAVAALAIALNPPQPWQMSSAALASYQTWQAKEQSTDIATVNPKYADDSPRRHHIVAQADHRAEEARRVLRNAGINPVKDVRNIVIIPHGFHKSMHTEKYHTYVSNQILQCSSDEEVVATLARLKSEIYAAAYGGPIPWI